jgi:hypothetical protein
METTQIEPAMETCTENLWAVGDEGKTWSGFIPEQNVGVPRYPTVEEVHISWKKVEE